MFIKSLTAKQQKCFDNLTKKKHLYYLNYGGSRSGKTILDTRFLILRAISEKYPRTRHLVCRASKTDCIASIWSTSLIPMLEQDFDKSLWKEDKTRRIITFWNGSQIWAGGFDNQTHQDDLLAKEWTTILIEEATELKYNNFSKLLTRLNWNPDLCDIPLKLICECNPPNRSHWLYKYFFEKIDYVTGEALNNEIADKLCVNHFVPYDNKENLSKDYLQILENLRGADRKRFLEGVFFDNTSGRIYEFDRRVNCVPEPIAFRPELESWRAWDFGIYPSSTFIIFMQVQKVAKSERFPLGLVIYIIDEYEAQNKDFKHYADICNEKPYENYNFRDAGDPAGRIRDASLESWVSKLHSEGIHMQMPKGKHGIDDYISHANQYVPYVRVCEKQCPKTVAFFENWAKPTDKDGKVIEYSKPNHDEFSHGGTAFYYWTMVRFSPRGGGGVELR